MGFLWIFIFLSLLTNRYSVKRILYCTCSLRDSLFVFWPFIFARVCFINTILSLYVFWPHHSVCALFRPEINHPIPQMMLWLSFYWNAYPVLLGLTWMLYRWLGTTGESQNSKHVTYQSQTKNEDEYCSTSFWHKTSIRVSKFNLY